MDRLDTYRSLLKELLTNHAERMRRNPQPNTEIEVTFDEENDQYMVLRIGWTPKGRVFVPTLYARLKDGKIWIENDWTDEGLANELVEKGISAQNVVLAFHPPDMRVHTEFAAA